MSVTHLNPARRRMGWRFAASMSAYVLAVAFISGWLGWEPPGDSPIVYGLAMLPPLAIGASIWSMGVYLTEEPDEFVRMLYVRAVIGAVGVTLFVTTAWGFLEHYAHVWAPPLFLVGPIFWASFGVVLPLVIRTYR